LRLGVRWFLGTCTAILGLTALALAFATTSTSSSSLALGLVVAFGSCCFGNRFLLSFDSGGVIDSITVVGTRCVTSFAAADATATTCVATTATAPTATSATVRTAVVAVAVVVAVIGTAVFAASGHVVGRRCQPSG